MLAAEAHFMGEPCWHVVEFYERRRLQRANDLCREAYRRNQRLRRAA